MKRLPTNARPTTYAEIIQIENTRHAGRLAELKRAEKLIRAIEPDLARLAEAGVAFDIGSPSVRLEDCSDPESYLRRSKWALRIDATCFSSWQNKLVDGFIELGWIVDSRRIYEHSGTVVLRRPKTQTRVKLDGNAEHIRHLPMKERE
jgi:hypothetical protein